MSNLLEQTRIMLVNHLMLNPDNISNIVDMEKGPNIGYYFTNKQLAGKILIGDHTIVLVSLSMIVAKELIEEKQK